MRDGYRRIGEFASGGIGPHDLTLLADGRHLVIANGGLKTLPESGREILNSDDIAPNLAVLDLATGDNRRAGRTRTAIQEAQHPPSGAQASDDGIVFACQHQGDADELPPLVGVLKPVKARPVCSKHPKKLWRGSTIMSVRSRWTASGSVIAATSPHGGAAALWSIDGDYLGGAHKFLTSAASPATGTGFW